MLSSPRADGGVAAGGPVAPEVPLHLEAEGVEGLLEVRHLDGQLWKIGDNFIDCKYPTRIGSRGFIQ